MFARINNSIFFVTEHGKLPSTEYDHKSCPSEHATAVVSRILGYDISENDARQSGVKFIDGILYLVYTAVVPKSMISSPYTWSGIEEIFNEKADGFTRTVVSETISYS